LRSVQGAAELVQPDFGQRLTAQRLESLDRSSPGDDLISRSRCIEIERRCPETAGATSPESTVPSDCSVKNADNARLIALLRLNQLPLICWYPIAQPAGTVLAIRGEPENLSASSRVRRVRPKGPAQPAVVVYPLVTHASIAISDKI
jgi:hypothetical protein